VNYGFRFVASSLLLFSCCVNVHAATHRLTLAKLKSLLESQGFSGGFEGRVRISRLGEMNCAANNLQVYYYTWEETNPPGEAIHAAYRILFFKDSTTYLGQYQVGDRPKLLQSNKLVFNYAEGDGNTIQCDQNGLPESVLINGEDLTLSK
jgi:hypothetical protein